MYLSLECTNPLIMIDVKVVKDANIFPTSRVCWVDSVIASPILGQRCRRWDIIVITSCFIWVESSCPAKSGSVRTAKHLTVEDGFKLCIMHCTVSVSCTDILWQYVRLDLIWLYRDHPYCFIFKTSIWKAWCLIAHFNYNNCDLAC